MKEQTFIEIHQAADRVALEAARTKKDDDQAEKYTSVYGKVSDYLVGVFKKAELEDD